QCYSLCPLSGRSEPPKGLVAAVAGLPATKSKRFTRNQWRDFLRLISRLMEASPPWKVAKENCVTVEPTEVDQRTLPASRPTPLVKLIHTTALLGSHPAGK